jgi:Domain of unknown function (DUF6378)
MRDPLLVEREKTHGDFKTVAEISQQIKELFDKYAVKPNPVYGINGPCPAQREALQMIAVKIARILSGDPHCKEHWNDIKGYAELGAEACLTDKQA